MKHSAKKISNLDRTRLLAVAASEEEASSMKRVRYLAGAAALAAAAAIGATALPAAASTVSQDIRKVPCTSTTFNVYYGADSEACYEGTGELPVDLSPVYEVTTGENTGDFTGVFHGTLIASVHFTPGEVFSYPAPFPATLTLIDITSA